MLKIFCKRTQMTNKRLLLIVDTDAITNCIILHKRCLYPRVYSQLRVKKRLRRQWWMFLLLYVSNELKLYNVSVLSEPLWKCVVIHTSHSTFGFRLRCVALPRFSSLTSSVCSAASFYLHLLCIELTDLLWRFWVCEVNKSRLAFCYQLCVWLQFS